MGPIGMMKVGIPPVVMRKMAAPRSVYGDEKRKTFTEKQEEFKREKQYEINKGKDSAYFLRMGLLGLAPGWWASDHAEEAQHFTGWNFIAVHAKAKQSAQAHFRAYRRTSAADRKEVKKAQHHPDMPEHDRVPLEDNHPVVKLMNRPNPRWWAPIWRYMISQQKELTGSALIWKVRDKGGDLTELWVIPTALARPQAPTGEMPMGSYWVTATGLFTMMGGYPSALGVGAMAGITIDARDVHKICWPHPTLLSDAQSPLAAGSVIIDLAEEIDQAAWAVMHNSVDPSLLLSLDAGMQVDEPELNRIEQVLSANRGGVHNRAKVMIVQGAKVEQTSRTIPELDYQNSRPGARDSVFGVHGVNAGFCATAEASGYSQLFASLKQSIEMTIQPELELIAGELTRLFQEEFKDDTIEIVATARSFDDPDVLDRKRNTCVAAKSITINEDRKLQGLAPVWWGEAQVGTVIPAHVIDEKLTDPLAVGPPSAPAGANDKGTPPKNDETDSGIKNKPDKENTGVKKPFLNEPNKKKSNERLRGGRADYVPEGKFDPDELERGIQVEMEHTNDREIASEIARDHLLEDPDYYDKLEQVEDEGEFEIESYEVAGHKVCIIDDFKFRDSSENNEQFVDYAIHDDFPQDIDDGEIWIASSIPEDERRYFVDAALTEMHALERGVSPQKAYEAGCRVQETEREKSTGIKENESHKEPPVKGLILSDYGTFDDDKGTVTVKYVNAELVRDQYKCDFSQGGHHYVYPWIPENEIWIEEPLQDDEEPLVILHEQTERALMRDKGMSYDKAHEIASEKEWARRHRLYPHDKAYQLKMPFVFSENGIA